jgi:hypothetical protein
MARRGLRGIPPIVWLLGLASLSNDVSSGALFPLLPLFLATLPGGSPAVLGLVEGAADALGSVMKVLAGRLSDRGPRRLLVVGGYALPATARAAIAAAALPCTCSPRGSSTGPGRDPRRAARRPARRRGAPGRGRPRLLAAALHGPPGRGPRPLVTSGLLAAGASIRATFWVAAGLGLAAPLLLAFRLRDPASRPPPSRPEGPPPRSSPCPCRPPSGASSPWRRSLRWLRARGGEVAGGGAVRLLACAALSGAAALLLAISAGRSRERVAGP